jgi:hypothetical protein
MYFKTLQIVIYGFFGKRVCLSKLVCLELTIEKTIAYYEICQVAITYELVMFYSKGTIFATLHFLHNEWAK